MLRRPFVFAAFALVTSVSPPVLGEEVADRELTETLAAVQQMAKNGKWGAGEALLEGLTRTRPEDPRAWFSLGEIRFAVGARRAATYAYHRAAGQASPSRRTEIEARLLELKLAAMPLRELLEDRDEFLDRAGVLACGTAARSGVVFEALECPQSGLSSGGRSFRLSSALVKQLCKDSRAWVREQVAAHAPLSLFRGGYLRVLLEDPAARVRVQLFQRLSAGATDISLVPAATAAVMALIQDPDLEVQLEAAAYQVRHGRVPVLASRSFRELVLRVDRGYGSREVAKRVLSGSPSKYAPVLLEILGGSLLEGKLAATMLLGISGGQVGQLSLAAALRDQESLRRFYSAARQALRVGTRGQGISLGETPEEWCQALASLSL